MNCNEFGARPGRLSNESPNFNDQRSEIVPGANGLETPCCAPVMKIVNNNPALFCLAKSSVPEPPNSLLLIHSHKVLTSFCDLNTSLCSSLLDHSYAHLPLNATTSRYRSRSFVSHVLLYDLGLSLNGYVQSETHPNGLTV